MICRHCHKEFDIADFCPHCGMSSKPSAETEKHGIRISRLDKGILTSGCVAIFIISILAEAISKVAEFNFFRSLVKATLLSGSILFGFIMINFNKLQGRGLPLIKRIAVVVEKKIEITPSISWKGGVSYPHYRCITFEFPDKTRRTFYATGAFHELAVGDRVILKYKLFGKKQKHEYYGYERYEGQEEQEEE